ncbi:prostaglandin D2 receptor 2 [Sinocyclocheilus rhinocerous]|uniref:prostaglandin D2 receptor 2 n=1 Tax=Sinocyclocheilus rhinocerous TaxID=307959 RepID=UPI0007BA286B|nr:PREDICTED: prostaglandin D2 receptor 2-like [Sinocyclocheilus rhinocerous]
MTSSFPPNSTLSPSSPSELHCPLLQTMSSHTLNKDTGVNLGVVSVHGVVSTLGILENGLVLWVLGFRLHRRTVAAVWVLNLALSDFLTTLTLPLFTHYLLMNHSWELGGALCAAQASIFFLNMFVSAFLLAVISLDRCLIVTKPVWTQNHRTVSAAWKICGLGWAWAAVNALPYFMFRSVVEKKDGRKLCYHNFALYSSSNTLHRDCKVRQAATAVSKVLLAFVIPLIVIAISYTSIFLELRARRKRLESRRQGASNGKLRSLKFFRSLSSSGRENSIRLSGSFMKMVVSVIATFILCWVPYHVFCLLEVTAQYKTEIVELVEVYLPVATTFAFLNSVLNPIIYAFSCPNFCARIRQSLGALFEGLVEEAGPIVWVAERMRKKDSLFPSSPSSPTPTSVTRVQDRIQGSINLFGFKNCPTNEGEREDKM